jgi:hypothetical protein
MRGKLRDKRSDAKRDIFKRDVIERRRTNKRGNRPTVWPDLTLEDDLLLDEEGETLVEANQQQPAIKK